MSLTTDVWLSHNVSDWSTSVLHNSKVHAEKARAEIFEIFKHHQKSLKGVLNLCNGRGKPF